MEINHAKLPQSVEIDDQKVNRIRERAIKRTCNLSNDWFALPIDYADTRDELEAIEPGELSVVLDRCLNSYGKLKPKQQDIILDELLDAVNQSL